MTSHRFVEVALPLPIFHTFTYSLPASCSHLSPGTRVLVPFGSRYLTGIAVKLHSEGDQGGIKAVRKILDDGPLLSPQLLQLGFWMTSHYFTPPGEALRVMFPPGLLHRRTLPEKKSWPAKHRLAIVQINLTSAPLTSRQTEVIQTLGRQALPVLLRSFLETAGCSSSMLRTLASKGAIRIEPVEVYRSPWSQPSLRVKKHRLNRQQQGVVDRIKERLVEGDAYDDLFHRVLIHGVTGSGKTEVYLNVIALVLSQGRSALMLVPEIGLTPQVSRYFRGWFGEDVAILHSSLSEGERFDQWRRIREGQCRVVVGTRSAIFAPLRRLGVIIVDEEQDSSYKQEEIPRYHARDTAMKRAQIERALLILGSATPQLETFYEFREQKALQYEVLSSRILERPMPTVHVVDMRVEFEKRGKAVFVSQLLEESIGRRLLSKEQVLLLLNRRGYSSVLLCRSCGHTEACENCSISLTYHRQLNHLSCHYCAYSRPVPNRCRSCGKQYIYFLGQGTEKVQEFVQMIFPTAVVDRLDRDAVRKKGGVERILEAFASGRTDILIGTQMIAKGHDFPRVTLVGVLAAEQALRLADFRSAERTFQLLTQVAGRAGRGSKPGEVVIQTYYPNHYSLRSACTQDYGRFFEEEIRFRRNFLYPPFTVLANLLVRGKNRQKTRRFAETILTLLLTHRSQCSSEDRMRLLGPASAALERLKGEYRFQILIKTTDRSELHQVLEKTIEALRHRRAPFRKISIDIDPISLL